MAPVASTSLNLEDDQRFALMKFRINVKDVCVRPEQNDYFLLRWLKARSWDVDAAEKMLRESLAWREKWGIDTHLPSWEPPEALIKHFPSGCSGYDKEGSPIIILPFAEMDLWGLLHAVTKTDVVRLVLKELETHLRNANEQGDKYGHKARQVVCIMDMEGFSMKQYAWRPVGELVISLLQMYEANYPEILKICYIVNAPKVFSLAFSIVKKFVHEYTISKIKIYKADRKKWEPILLSSINPNQLPQHYGGTQVDPDGNPRCPSKIRPGGKVPKKYHVQKITEEKKAQYTNVTIKSGDKHCVHLISAEPGCFLRWEFGVEEYDIKFSVMCMDSEGEESVTVKPRKISGKAVETGVVAVNGPATYTVIFDNTSSYLRNKKIYYNVLISPPISELEISTLPNAEDDLI